MCVQSQLWSISNSLMVCLPVLEIFHVAYYESAHFKGGSDLGQSSTTFSGCPIRLYKSSTGTSQHYSKKMGTKSNWWYDPNQVGFEGGSHRLCTLPTRYALTLLLTILLQGEKLSATKGWEQSLIIRCHRNRFSFSDWGIQFLRCSSLGNRRVSDVMTGWWLAWYRSQSIIVKTR